MLDDPNYLTFPEEYVDQYKFNKITVQSYMFISKYTNSWQQRCIHVAPCGVFPLPLRASESKIVAVSLYLISVVIAVPFHLFSYFS